MLYEKASVEVIDFGKSVSFMAFSGGPQGKADAEREALKSAQVLDAIQDVGGQCYAEVYSSVYDQATGVWTITVHVNNHGGHLKKVVVVLE